MNKKQESVAASKSIEFSVRVVNLYRHLCDEHKEFVMSKQLLRSGTSIGANIHEAEYAQSKADFIAKMFIALKEASETEYWLQVLKRTDYLTQGEYESIVADCIEMLKILTAIVKTAKSNK